MQTILQEMFNKPLSHKVNPDEAVAAGATILAAKLTNNIKEEILEIQDVTSLPLGVATNFKGNKGMKDFSVIIPKNTKLPAAKQKTYYTMNDNQKAVSFPIYEGESTKIE